MGIGSLIAFTFFWLVTAPLLVFLHELGHALPTLAFGTGPVTIELGDPAKPGWTIAMGRLRFCLRPFSTTFGFVSGSLEAASPGQRMVVFAGGPAVSLVVTVVLGVVIRFVAVPEWLEFSLSWACWGALTQTLFTALPIRYPEWMGSYAGMPSDGRRILTILRERQAERGAS